MGLFHKHEWEEIEGTRQLYDGGVSKEAKYICRICGKIRWFDIFNVPKNTYVFKEYSKGEISDGSHTFNELYFHRMSLFAVICNTYRDKAWKSWLHEDGSMFQDYFIVGISTPNGDYSYHYHRDYWGYFNVPELNRAPAWDGHQPEDIKRLHSLCGHNNIMDLLEWLKGEKYIHVNENSTTMTEEFEREHRHELSTNIMINRTIDRIKKMMLRG